VRRLKVDWYGKYGVCPVLIETFVDISRFTGVCLFRLLYYSDFPINKLGTPVMASVPSVA
jgi:hypothetical protein